MNEPTLHAVVEISGGPNSWVSTPPEPWPPFVRLFDRTPPEHMSLIAYVLSWYNSISRHIPPLSTEELAKEESLVLPGGLAATNGMRTIYPSCCSGLEQWRDWFKLYDGAGSPWMGHDPSPFVENSDAGFIVWPDGGLNEPLPEKDDTIFFTRANLKIALTNVTADLQNFLSSFHSWFITIGINHPEAIIKNFAKSFYINE